MKKYAIVDTAHSFFKCKHISNRDAKPEEKADMAVHIFLTHINAMVNNIGVDHIIFALEGNSWRKEAYKPYKAHRQQRLDKMTPEEQKTDEAFKEVFEKLVEFLKNKTNCTLLQDSDAEADDMIARFIALHPNDNHYIVSGDSDYHQLIAPNVVQYCKENHNREDSKDCLVTTRGYVDMQGNPIIDRKTGEHKMLGDPQYVLFKKIIRGDTADNIFPAFPGCREKGSKKTIGIREAYENKHKEGFVYTNFMLQRWLDHDNVEHKVIDDYDRNRLLIDLTAIPDELKQQFDESIKKQLVKKVQPMIGINFLKFCKTHNLENLSKKADHFSRWMAKSYEV
jgi:5'-3' exonuclease